MQLIELRTVMMIMLIICGLGLLLVTILWRENCERFDGMHFWVLAFAFQTFASLLIMLRGFIPDGLSIIAGNFLMAWAALLVNIGLENFLNKKGPQIQNYILLVVYGAFCFFYTYVDPDVNARIIVSSAVLSIIFFQGAWLAFHRVDKALRRVTRGIGLVIAGFAALSLIRLLIIMVNPEPRLVGYFDLGIVQTVIIVVYIMLFILEPYSLSLMINRKLFFELQTEEQKFSKAFYTAPYGIVIARLAGGVILEVNDVFLSMTGYTREEIVGKSGLDLNVWYNKEECNSLAQSLRKGGEVRDKELLFKKKNGEVFCGLASSDILVINQTHCVLSSVMDITERKQQQFEREALIEELQQALAEVKTLSGLLPICSSCKKIRDDKGYWNSIEVYIHNHSGAKLTHGICPECRNKLYPEYATGKRKTGS